MREDLGAINVRLFALEQQNTLLDSLLSEQRQLTLSQRSALTQQMQTQNEQLSMISARQDEINFLLHDLLTQLEEIQLYGGIRPAPQGGAPQQGAPAQPGSSMQPSGVNVNPEALYKAAMDDIAGGSFELAESRLLTFLMQFPDHDLAVDAQYQLGETAIGQGQFDDAVQEFNTFQKKYPKSPLIPASMLREGHAQEQAGDIRTAQQTWRQLIKSYPRSKEAAEAKKLIQ